MTEPPSAEGAATAGADLGAEAAPRRHLNVRQAAFIGVGSMVGAGIFSLLGAAGEVAGAAVWISFAIAGLVAMLQGYSFARMGARFPSAAGMLEYVRRGWGDGHFTGIFAWIVLATNAVVTAMVAVSFGSYAASVFSNEHNTTWVKFFAVVLVLAMSALNIGGSQVVARAQTIVVVVVLTMLTIFAVATLSNLHPHLLAASGYPSFKHIVSSVALTFFAFLGFGVVTFTAAELRNPKRQLPRAMFLALGIATTIYIAVSLGVFGTLTVDKVIASGGTALAVAAEPVLGRAGFWMMTVTALFSTAGATNAGLFPAGGICEEMANTTQFPPLLGRRFGSRAPAGLLLTALAAIVLAVGYDLNAIASVGSAIALIAFALVTVGHFRVRHETGANVVVLGLAILTTVVVFTTFLFTTLVHEPATIAAIVVIVALSVLVDFAWKRHRDQGARGHGRLMDRSIETSARA
jgi:amino acid transporter